MHDDIGAGAATDLVAGPDAPVAHDHVALSDMVAGGGQGMAHARQHAAQLFVERVGVQAVRYDHLHLRTPQRVERVHRARVLVPQALSRGRRGQVLVAAGGFRTDDERPHRRVADHRLVDGGVERFARVPVESVNPGVSRARVGHAEVPSPLLELLQLPPRLVLERGERPAVTAGAGVGGAQPRDGVGSGPGCPSAIAPSVSSRWRMAGVMSRPARRRSGACSRNDVVR